MTLSVDKVWTYEAYCDLPDDGKRYEVLEGQLHMTPSTSSFHQTLSRRLQFVFYQLELEQRGLIFNAPIDLFMEDAQPAQPDLVFLKPGQEHLVTKRGIEGVPELVVEILSPSTATQDRTIKLRLYERAGVRRYAMLDPSSRTLELFLLDGLSYRLETSLGPDEHFELLDYGITIDMVQLFRGLPHEI